MAPKGRGEAKETSWKVKGSDDSEVQAKPDKGGKKGGGKSSRGEGQQWSNRDDGEDDGNRRQKGKGGGRKGGKADGGSDDRWNKDQGWDQGARRGGGAEKGSGGNRNRGGGGSYQGGGDDYYEGGYGYGGGYGASAGGYGYPPWQADAQESATPPPPPAMRLWTEYVSADGTPYYYNSRTGLTQWERPAALDPPKPAPAEVPEKAESGDAGKGGRGPRTNAEREDRRNDGEGRGSRGDGGDRDRRPGGNSGDGGDRPRGGKNKGNRKDGGGAGGGGSRAKGGQDKEPSDFGPPGCNLFVFHLPDDWTDDDLHEYFAPHGNVVSAKVMKELGTGRSRGFGFVSYEERIGAATAIKKMQGYKILGKRLKVEFKKGEGQDMDELAVEADEGGSSKKSYPDDERLIGYLRAISAKNVVQSLKESEGAPDDADEPGIGSGMAGDEDEPLNDD